MFVKIAYYYILGLPLIGWMGILTLLSLLTVASIGLANMRGWHKIPLKWHFRLAAVTLILAAIHGFIGLMVYISR